MYYEPMMYKMALLHLISLQFSVLAMDLICVKDKRNCNTIHYSILYIHHTELNIAVSIDRQQESTRGQQSV